MKFICLHGSGTNSEILKIQTAAFRQELGDQHTFEFVQGVVPYEVPAELQSLSTSSEHYAYFNEDDNQSFATALNDLELYLSTEGPFDGVLAFSQGAGLAAMHIVRKYYANPSSPPPFKVALLFAPISVYDPKVYEETGTPRVLDNVENGNYPINIPTLIVYGEADARKGEAQGICRIVRDKHLFTYVHPGGHEIPGFGSKDAVREMVRYARRAISRAGWVE